MGTSSSEDWSCGCTGYGITVRPPVIGINSPAAPSSELLPSWLSSEVVETTSLDLMDFLEGALLLVLSDRATEAIVFAGASTVSSNWDIRLLILDMVDWIHQRLRSRFDCSILSCSVTALVDKVSRVLYHFNLGPYQEYV